MRRSKRGLPALFFLLAVLTPVAVMGAESEAISPGNRRGTATVVDRCPTFSWSAAGTSQGYEVAAHEICPGGCDSPADGEPATLQSSARPVLHERLPAGAFSWTPPLERCLERGRSYGWAVRALDAEGPGPWSEVRIFRVGIRPSAEEVRAALSMLEEYLEQEGGSDVNARRVSAGTGEQPTAGQALLSRETEGRSEQEGAPTEASVYQGDLFPPPVKPTEMVISGGDEAGARVVIEADTDNNEEADHPSVRLAQDGGLVYGFVGFSDAENDLKIKAGAYGHDNDIAFYTGGFLTPGPEERLRITSEGEIRWAPQTSTAFVGVDRFKETCWGMWPDLHCHWTGPLPLPVGAKVVKVTVYWRDNSPENARLEVRRGVPPDTVIRVDSSFHEPGVRLSYCPDSPECIVFDAPVTVGDYPFHQLYYEIPRDSGIEVLGVRIEYTVTRPH